ncbi:MAG: hypothetical protein R3B67_07330 [Phycisphaerales bacterium]
MATPTSGRGSRNRDAVVFLIKQPDDTLVLSEQIPVGRQPVGIDTGDLNQDGIPDIVTANENSDDITILLSDTTNGGFSRTDAA